MFSVFQWAGLEGRLAVFDVDTELHALGAVAIHQRLAVLLQSLLELFESEAVGALTALLLETHEFLVNGAPLGVFRVAAAPIRHVAAVSGKARTARVRLVPLGFHGVIEILSGCSTGPRWRLRQAWIARCAGQRLRIIRRRRIARGLGHVFAR